MQSILSTEQDCSTYTNPYRFKYNKIFYSNDEKFTYDAIRTDVSRYSESKLRTEHIIPVETTKFTYNMRISDIHYEIDVRLLGCNHRILWDEIYRLIYPIVLSKPVGMRRGIIVLRGFQNVHPDLHSALYGYIQQCRHDKDVDIVFYIQTTCISFIRDDIRQSCRRVNIIKTPETFEYIKNYIPISPTKNPQHINNIDMSELVNDKVHCDIGGRLHVRTCDELVRLIGYDYAVDKDNNIFTDIRNRLYDILFLDIDMNICLWYITTQVIDLFQTSSVQTSEIINAYIRCFIGHNNNYRPIYHLERFILTIVKTIHFESGIGSESDGNIETYEVKQGMFDFESPVKQSFSSINR